MKKRTDFVSNSSSSSFVINNPYQLKDDGKLLLLLGHAHYLHFVDVDYGDGIGDFRKFKAALTKAFASKVSVDFERQDTEDSPPEGVYVELEYDFYKRITDKKRNVLLDLLKRSNAVYLNFGMDYEGGSIAATQIATMLDYLYDADIQADDHFEYTPLSELGIIPFRGRK